MQFFPKTSKLFFSFVYVVMPFILCLAATSKSQAQEKPYFVTYSQDLEEPGNLEIETKSSTGKPDGGNRYGASAVEIEYGTRAWWTTEFYLDGQTTAQDSTVFTGFRVENRIRPLLSEHWINPVLYVEYENTTGADKTVLEVEGHDDASDLAVSNADGGKDRQHEAELKLILSSNTHGWNISENFIGSKVLGHDPWEFGYAVGAVRPLRLMGSGRPCTFCAEKFMAGVEAYGGLGDTWSLSTGDTSHYIAPLIGWQLPKNVRVSFSPGFGMTDVSLDRVYRFGLAYEFER